MQVEPVRDHVPVTSDENQYLFHDKESNMKHKLLFCLALAILIVVLPTLAPVVTAQPKSKPKPLVAVMPFRTTSEELREFVRTVWVEELKKSAKVRVLSRKQVDKRLKAMSIAWQEYDWSLNAKQIGKALGAQYIVTGVIEDRDTGVISPGDNQKRTYTLTMKAQLIDTSTGEVAWADEATEQLQVQLSVEGLFKAATKRLARTLAKEAAAVLGEKGMSGN